MPDAQSSGARVVRDIAGRGGSNTVRSGMPAWVRAPASHARYREFVDDGEATGYQPVCRCESSCSPRAIGS